MFTLCAAFSQYELSYAAVAGWIAIDNSLIGYCIGYLPVSGVAFHCSALLCYEHLARSSSLSCHIWYDAIIITMIIITCACFHDPF
jgi:hypothetical protein